MILEHMIHFGKLSILVGSHYDIIWRSVEKSHITCLNSFLECNLYIFCATSLNTK